MERQTYPGQTASSIGTLRLARSRLIAGGAAAAAAIATLAPAALRSAVAAPESGELRLEVCCDGRTFKLDNGAITKPVSRGSSFIVNGALYPAGTFASGPTNPGAPGSLGTWICRGSFLHDLEALAKGAVPHVATTQYYFFNDGSLLISDGVEGGQWVLRAITGGTGRYAGAAGICTQDEVATNNSKIQLGPGIEIPAPNLVFNFQLT